MGLALELKAKYAKRSVDLSSLGTLPQDGGHGHVLFTLYCHIFCSEVMSPRRAVANLFNGRIDELSMTYNSLQVKTISF